MDAYLGDQCNDSMIFVICKDPDSDNSAYIRVTADINSDLDDTIQLSFNSEKKDGKVVEIHCYCMIEFRKVYFFK